MLTVADAQQPTTHNELRQEEIIIRLRRLEGQVRGIQRMVEEGRDCVDIVTQLQAVSAAANKVAQQLLETHLRSAIAGAIREQQGEEAINDLLDVLGKALHR